MIRIIALSLLPDGSDALRTRSRRPDVTMRFLELELCEEQRDGNRVIRRNLPRLLMETSDGGKKGAHGGKTVYGARSAYRLDTKWPRPPGDTGNAPDDGRSRCSADSGSRRL